MLRKLMCAIFMLPMSVFANDVLTPNHLIGKWQCHFKHHDPLIKQESVLHFFKNNTMSEQTYIYYGQKDEYAYQIESATAKSTWSIKNNQLYYDNHQFYNYAVRMPNAHKEDLQQANIALQKSLPMIKDMMNKDINQRRFDINLTDKKMLIMHDVDSQQFVYCQKRNWLNALFN